MAQTVRVKVLRQDEPGAKSYWQEFDVPWTPGMNALSCLQEIQKNPVTADGKPVAPVVWESSCLEEVCGACSMRINGIPRQGCSYLVSEGEHISFEPMSTFPVVRDLLIDRDRMFRALLESHSWIDIDGTHDLGPGPRQSPKDQSWMYVLSRCMTCGCCLDACPQVNDRSDFVGPSVISQVRLFNAHPSGKMHEDKRLEYLMQPGGIVDCGNAQNCVKVCPKEIPLTQGIAEMGKATMAYSLKRFFRKADLEM
ncbi:succinate dehydrogenase iron-sulfur subunit [bacterium]|nr:succinate dehydrogenase iron-sulfur subunit [bacterium]MCB1221035.1 succinate dehydrogenase iron-sulfur subunit [bacterium]UNM08517.1 MAG: succinate dehydrogenase iron-sulfur subunit [Planctomycetales bacterium]